MAAAGGTSMSQTNLTELQGLLEHITYANEETGYAIVKVKVAGHKDLVACVGNLLRPTPGEIVVMTGEWTNHEKYGRQFKVATCETKTPASVYGIQKYLGSGLIKGIGPVMAKRIVGKYGKKTLEIIEHHSEKLAEIPGIGAGRIGMIRQAWEDQKEIRAVMLFLQTHGVSAGFAAKIFKHYGKEAVRIVQDNPYRLAADIFGIGFITADKIAEKLGLPKESPVRAEAGILYVLSQLADQGHVYAPSPFCRTGLTILDIDAAIIQAMEKLQAAGRTPPKTARNRPTGHLQLALHVVRTRRQRGSRPSSAPPKQFRQIDTTGPRLSRRLAITLAEKQLQAIRTAVITRS